MPVIKLKRSFIAVLACVWFLVGKTVVAGVPTNSIPIQASIVPENVPNLATYFRVYINAETTKFTFILPREYRADKLTSERVQLVNNDYNRFLSLRLLGPLPADTEPLDAAGFRELILSLHPGAKILEEFSLHAANHTGPAFDLEWVEANGIIRCSRVAFIPSAAGVLEFDLVCNDEQFAEAKRDLNSLMLTFRASDSSGHLEINPISDML